MLTASSASTRIDESCMLERAFPSAEGAVPRRHYCQQIACIWSLQCRSRVDFVLASRGQWRGPHDVAVDRLNLLSSELAAVF